MTVISTHWDYSDHSDKDVEIYILSDLRDVTYITLSYRYFKNEWGTVSLIIEGPQHVLYQI